MKVSTAILAVTLAAVALTCRANDAKSLWDKYEAAPQSDGKIRLRTFWVRSAPAHDIISESGVERPSEKKGLTYEFFVLVENVGKQEIEVPSIVDRTSRAWGMPMGHSIVVPYLVKFGDLLGRITFVESASAFRPVKLKPEKRCGSQFITASPKQSSPTGFSTPCTKRWRSATAGGVER